MESLEALAEEGSTVRPVDCAAECAALRADLCQLRRDVTNCIHDCAAIRSENAAMRECLERMNVLRKETMLAQLHRQRFTRQWAAQRASAAGIEGAAGAAAVPLALSDVLSVHNLVLLVSVNAGLYSVQQACTTCHAISTSTREALSDLQRQNVIYVCGGTNGSNGLGEVRSVESFNPVMSRWYSLPPMNEKRGGAGAGVLGGKVFLCGGFTDGSKPVCSVECFNPKAGCWEVLPPMNVPRGGLTVSVIAGAAFAIGGRDGRRQPLRTVERFSPQSQSWEILPQMLERRFMPVAAVLGDSVYICGGHGGEDPRPLSSVEVSPPFFRFSSAANQWRRAPDMRSARVGASAATVSGRLHVAGGWSGGKDLNSVESLGVNSEAWMQLPEMLTRRAACAAAVVAGQLCVFGGVDGKVTLREVESYDPQADRWKTMPSLLECRESAAVVAGPSW